MNKKCDGYISPFRFQLLQSFPYIVDDFDQYTEYQLFCKLVEKVNEVIGNENEITKKVNDIKEYLETLDLQDEVNNKLDEMAESGELENIIAEFLNANCIIKFSNIQEMQDSELLIENNIVGVFGNQNINDGFVQYYVVTTETTETPLQNNLYAKKIYSNKIDGSYIIDEIEQFQLYVENSKSTIQIFKIPNKDKFGKDIQIKHGFSNDIENYTPCVETATHFSNRKKATLVTNASIYDVSTSSPNYHKILGLIIHNGEVVTDSRQYYGGDTWYQSRYILGLKSNGLLEAYVGNINSQTLLNAGVIESWTGFIPILVNGQNNRDNLLNRHNWTSPEYIQTEDISPNSNKIYYSLENNEYVGHYGLTSFSSGITYFEQSVGERYPRQIIAQNGETKDFYILSSNGKGLTSNLGSTFEEVITLLHYIDENITFAYALDEGGSVETVYKNINYINTTDNPTNYSAKTDGIGYTLREVADFIYFSKDTETQKDLDINNLYSEIQNLKTQIKNLKLYTDVNSEVNTGNSFQINNYANETLNTNLIRFSQIQNDNTMKAINSIVSNVSTDPISFSFYDNVNNKTLFRFKSNGTIWTNEGDSLLQLANIFSKIKLVTDINSIRETCVVFTRGNTTNAPFNDTTTRGNMILNFYTNQDGGINAQIGLFCGGAPTKIAYRCMTNGSNWTAWKYITFD